MHERVWYLVVIHAADAEVDSGAWHGDEEPRASERASVC